MRLVKLIWPSVGADYGDEHKHVHDQDRSYSRVACHPERSLVMLSAAKDLALGKEMLRCAQHDTPGFGSLQCIIGLGGCSATPMNK
jgi:hypothetical protein